MTPPTVEDAATDARQHGFPHDEARQNDGFSHGYVPFASGAIRRPATHTSPPPGLVSMPPKAPSPPHKCLTAPCRQAWRTSSRT